MPTTATPTQPRSYAAMARLVLAHAERELRTLHAETTRASTETSASALTLRAQATRARQQLRNAKKRQGRALLRTAALRRQLLARLSQGAPAGGLLRQLQLATARLARAAAQAAALRTTHAALRAAVRASQAPQAL